jgi:alanine-glyoxylate transaminase/serine-glyoxylate transaminase/serine-pyruvate transaminase
MDEWGVDLAISGSQKGFMPTGLAIGGKPEGARGTRRQSARCFFDFADMIRTNKDGYFPARDHPARLRASIDLLPAQGLVPTPGITGWPGVRRAVCETHCANARDLRDTVTRSRARGCDGNEVVKQAYQRYRLSLGVGLSKVAGKVFRIGHLGSLNELMVLTALAGAEMAMRDAGIPVPLGSGVAAAQAHFLTSKRPAEIARAAA